MNNLLQNEREVSNDLRIENTQLKAKIGELEPDKVNGKNQCNRTPTMDSSSPDSYHDCSWLLSQMNQWKSKQLSLNQKEMMRYTFIVESVKVN